MRRVQRAVVLVLLALVATSAMAQIHGIPASATSMGSRPGFSSPGIPASVGSLGPHGFGNGFGFGGGIGFGARFGHHPRFNVVFNSFPRRHFFPVVVPVYVAPYYYPPAYSGYGYPVTYDPHSIDEPVTRTYADDREDRNEALTIFERGYRAGHRAALDERADRAYERGRYGDHYLDDREEQRPSRQPEPQVKVVPGPEREKAAPREAPGYEQPTTMLIFKNGDRMEVHNYAIVGDTVWVLSTSAARKVALNDLDLDKTVKENDQRGNPFKLPKLPKHS